ncbi:D-glycero-beta-D-manno-heptose-7-phosphate kinase [Hippea maritima]|uniref:RfaE bifunctional protein n=1 Tax=Hippea maritima (strain ATCC 700847 / DSM 10411 / MH2) TaxID=760142 RepID=F2LTS4_HIPMA|nr:D-glycero-beta-D-manno-heptose-7-phosphate kinase [Hippea maritima]AEA34450.1 rfaE bifunctional protein [Hippea maritima DSM 10411]
MKIENLKNAKVAVVGDLICDKYVIGKVERISPEAPVPVVRVEKETYFLGGASNVALNLKSLGCDVHLFGVVGNDSCGRRLVSMIKKSGLNTDGVMVLSDRPTTLKTRVIAQSQQIVRFDREKILQVDKKYALQIASKVKEAGVNAVIVSDYGKGVVSEYLIKALLDLNVFVAVDPKINNAEAYRGVDIITPNLKEARDISGVEIEAFVNGIELAAKKIIKRTQCRYLLITQGEKGMSLFDKNGLIMYQASQARDVYDVTGAGDTVIAVLTAAISSGFDIKDAVKLSNAAAGIVVGKMGTATVSLGELEGNI